MPSTYMFELFGITFIYTILANEHTKKASFVFEEIELIWRHVLVIDLKFRQYFVEMSIRTSAPNTKKY